MTLCDSSYQMSRMGVYAFLQANARIFFLAQESWARRLEPARKTLSQVRIAAADRLPKNQTKSDSRNLPFGFLVADLLIMGVLKVDLDDFDELGPVMVFRLESARAPDLEKLAFHVLHFCSPLSREYEGPLVLSRRQGKDCSELNKKRDERRRPDFLPWAAADWFPQIYNRNRGSSCQIGGRRRANQGNQDVL